MHSWFILILFGYLLLHVSSRPQQAEYNNDSDAAENSDEEEEDSADEAYSADDDSRLNDQDPSVQEAEVPQSRHLLDLTGSKYMQNAAPGDQSAGIQPDMVFASKAERNQETPSETENFNEPPNLYPKRRQLNKYNDANDEQQKIQRQRLINHDISKPTHVQAEDENLANKRTVEYETTANEEEGDMIFEKKKEQLSYINKNENSANGATDSEQLRYLKQYNTMQTESKAMEDDKSHDGVPFQLRDRRNINEGQSDNTNLLTGSKKSNENSDKTSNEDEESAIKRHVQKLSKDELDQLLNSLTEEKRDLLKKIMGDTDTSDNSYINKREITKKAGAAENSYIENFQSDLSKVQGGSASLEVNTEASSSQTTETESNKPDSQSSNFETTQKTAELSLAPVNKDELTNNKDDEIQKAADASVNSFSLNLDPKNQADIIASVQVTSKTDSKREANIEDLEDSDDSLEYNKMSGQDYLNDQGYFCSQDESLDDDSQPNENKNYKREAYYEKQPDLSEDMKSLEESFPNSNVYDNSGSYSGPLIRVKRKNYDQVVKKRSARLLPDAKVAYFPYKAENDDEDNDEGNEFDDEGFYDRTSNFANNNKAMDEDTPDKSENVAEAKNMNADNTKSSNENIDSDTMSLGSDTDSVLSGIEGVDDNLMYNGGVRTRRTAEENSNDATEPELDNSTPVMQDDMKSQSESYINLPHYQESDAFGPLPQNYDADLARYKRIRRVKQSHNSEELSDNFD